MEIYATQSSDYDLRRLTRGIVLSNAYARSSRWENDKVPEERFFAMAMVRPLAPLQLATSLKLATADPSTMPADQSPPPQPQAAAPGRGPPVQNRNRH